MTEADILYEKGDYWVRRGAENGYEVYKVGITHSTRCAIIGGNTKNALTLAVQECDRRAAGFVPEGRGK